MTAFARARAAGPVAWAGARPLVRAMRGESLRLRAMALTYLSLFAVVPALVVAFSVVRGFAGTDLLWRLIHEYLLDNLAVGARTSIEPYLDRFVRNAHATSAGLVGGALLLFSAVSLFDNVERAVNDIWSVRRYRPLAQRALLCWAGLTLGPILLAGSLALGHAVSTFVAGAPVGQLLVRLAAALLSCSLFAAGYFFLPATRVRPGAAVLGGVVAGLAWELAKGLYTFAVARFFSYHAVYGSVAAVPIFLLWLFVSWTLVLFGARVAFVAQHARVILKGHAPAGQGTPLGRELLAARVTLEIALAYRDGAPPPDSVDLALRIESFPDPVREIVAALRARSLILEVTGGGLVPGRPLDQLSLAEIRAAVAGEVPVARATPAEALLSAILTGAEGAAAEALANRSFAELCARVSPRGQAKLDDLAAERP
ncbi:MAG TPA: YihY/virulence factor BrkB family protein [Anaeromyxobacteraceae bacterium]|nr:YihY/virulence factor BrkB family protein [Anaeromyxobacteraceae bacterium]